MRKWVILDLDPQARQNPVLQLQEPAKVLCHVMKNLLFAYAKQKHKAAV